MDALNEILSLLKDTPDLALKGLVIWIFYKLAMWGSIVGSVTAILKLAILKYHDLKVRPKTIEKVYKIQDYVLSDALDEFDRLLYDVVKPGLNYIHLQDVQYLRQAYKEKKERDIAPKS